jgi:Protein of unknown function (DUF2934)
VRIVNMGDEQFGQCFGFGANFETIRTWSRNLLIGPSVVFTGDGISRRAGQSHEEGERCNARWPSSLLLWSLDRAHLPTAAKEVSPMTTPTREQIIHRAYELWERAGKPDGRDEEFYHQAEKELNRGVTGEEKSETFLE